MRAFSGPPVLQRSGGQFYSANRSGEKVSQGILDSSGLWACRRAQNAYGPSRHFPRRTSLGISRDRRADSRPAWRRRSGRAVNDSHENQRASSRVQGYYYPGAPHGLTATHQDRVNADLLAFLRPEPHALIGLFDAGADIAPPGSATMYDENAISSHKTGRCLAAMTALCGR